MPPEIKELLTNINDRVEEHYRSTQLALEKIEHKLDARLESRDKKMEAIELRLRELERTLDKQRGINTVLGLVGTTAATTIIIYLINQLIQR
jgi:hypothetical protein